MKRFTVFKQCILDVMHFLRNAERDPWKKMHVLKEVYRISNYGEIADAIHPSHEEILLGMHASF